jgi:hypothetical protein
MAILDADVRDEEAFEDAMLFRAVPEGSSPAADA